MRRFSTRELTFAAIVAALYAVMGYFGDTFGMTFGPVQIRFAEALTVLPFLFPSAAPGLVLGCLVTNLLSPYGIADIVFGTLATAIAAFLTTRVPRWYLAAVPPIVVNALILPPLWAWAETGGFNALTFVAGEAAVCCGLGTLLLRALPKTGLPAKLAAPKK